MNHVVLLKAWPRKRLSFGLSCLLWLHHLVKASNLLFLLILLKSWFLGEFWKKDPQNSESQIKRGVPPRIGRCGFGAGRHVYSLWALESQFKEDESRKTDNNQDSAYPGFMWLSGYLALLKLKLRLLMYMQEERVCFWWWIFFFC